MVRMNQYRNIKNEFALLENLFLFTVEQKIGERDE